MRGKDRHQQRAKRGRRHIAKEIDKRLEETREEIEGPAEHAKRHPNRVQP